MLCLLFFHNLITQEQVGSIRWQKSLDRLEDVMAVRFRNIFKVKNIAHIPGILLTEYKTAGLRRPEIDQYGNMKRVATRPKAMRVIPQPLNDREVLLLGVFSLWRINTAFRFKNMTESDIQDWIATMDKIWEAPIDHSVKVSGANALRLTVETVFATSPAEPADPLMVKFIQVALYVSNSTSHLQYLIFPEVQLLY
jgi:hypothetical protein